MEMRITSRFVKEIDRAIATGKLHEPFRAEDLRRAIPTGFAFNTYSHFLSKHVRGNGRYKEYFERIEPGLYRRLRK